MNSSSNTLSSSNTSESVFVLPLIPLVDFSSSSSPSVDEDDNSADSSSGPDADFSGSYVEAMD